MKRKTSSSWEKKKKKRTWKMSENTQTPMISKEDKNEGLLEIRADNGSAGRLEIYFRHPVLAEVVEKMGMGNYPGDQFDKVYEPCLLAFPDTKAKGKVVSRPAIYTTTKNIVGGTDFDFTQPPRGVLIANPGALRAGFSLFIDLKAPIPPDTLRKWGKMLMDGCADIISASRPFTMQWVMTESVPHKL